MKTAAAVLVETGKPLVLADLEIPRLGAGQVLVEVALSGVCHTQLLESRGFRGADRYLPHCLGHEGAGVVREAGPGVRKVSVGDRVILSWMKGSGADVNGAVYGWNGRSVNAGGITTFSRLSVISENRLTVVSGNLPMPHAALLGCAVPTGLGAVFNTAQPRAGQSIAIFGTGGIGLCAVAGAALAGCFPVIAVDIREEKLRLAKELGATHALDAGQVDPVEKIKALCPGGSDFAIEASGRPSVMQQALSCVRPQGGAAVIVGNARQGERLEVNPWELNLGKRLLGTWGGDNVPDRDFQRYVKLVASGKLNLQPLVSKSYGLSGVNEALDDLEAGRVTRPLIDMSLS
ncbi:MAG: zinc-binding dehydrogenase [Candidatus Omnitrophica bacterium]|nr:zinc-binding dehydrogenase [Candidatus Omnitrophota bacterium]